MELKPDQQDALCELMNIGVGMAAAELHEMLELPIKLSVVEVALAKGVEVSSDDTGRDMSAVFMGFSGPYEGTASLLFPADSARNLTAALLRDEEGEVELDAVRAGALTEVGNILLNGIMGSMGNMLGGHLDYSVPDYVEGNHGDLLRHRSSPDTLVAWARTRFGIEEVSVDGSILVLFRVGSFQELLSALDRMISDEEVA